VNIGCSVGNLVIPKRRWVINTDLGVGKVLIVELFCLWMVLNFVLLLSY
jgi:hypothetical protein